MINIPKGTKDVLPQESYKWQYAENKAREVCRLFNFREIRTPVFEHTELFTRSIGDDTDVVKKEMYTFLLQFLGFCVRIKNRKDNCKLQ